MSNQIKHKTLTIIVTYNGEQWLPELFSSLQKNSTDILVVDCASTDATKEKLKDYPINFTHFSDQNLGFGKANNIGLQYAIEHDYEYVFLVNQDTIVPAGTVEKLIAIAEQNNEFGIISPLHFFNENALDLRFAHHLLSSGRYNTTEEIISSDYQVLPVGFVNAAFWFLPVETIHTVGGFDPLFQHYAEDDNYVERVKQNGLKIGVTPSVRAFHLRKQELKNPNPTKEQKSIALKNKNLLRLLNPSYSFLKGFSKVVKGTYSELVSTKNNKDTKKQMAKNFFQLLLQIPAFLSHRKLYNSNQQAIFLNRL